MKPFIASNSEDVLYFLASRATTIAIAYVIQSMCDLDEQDSEELEKCVLRYTSEDLGFKYAYRAEVIRALNKYAIYDQELSKWYNLDRTSIQVVSDVTSSVAWIVKDRLYPVCVEQGVLARTGETEEGVSKYRVVWPKGKTRADLVGKNLHKLLKYIGRGARNG